MVYTILEDLILYQTLSYIRRFSNYELKLRNFFIKVTKIIPNAIILLNQFIFIFINNDLMAYNKAKKHIDYLRSYLLKKVLLIREQSTLINLIYSFFPDIFIYDVDIKDDHRSNNQIISLSFLSYRDRAIAIGCKGDYIKTINKLLKKYIILQNRKTQLKIECKIANQNEIHNNLKVYASI